MTTISTTQHQRTPLWTALAVAGALTVGGAVGITIGQTDDGSPAATHATQTTPDSFGGATTSQELSGTTSGSLPATGAPGGATTAQESTG